MAEEKTVSGEEYRAMSGRSKKPGKQVTVSTQPIVLVIGAVVVCIVSFFIGVNYQKNHSPKVATSSSSALGGAGGPGARFRNGGGFGQVTAISSTSISLQNQRTSATQTFTIDGSTQITDNGQTVTTSDIQVGSVVIVRVASSGSTTASAITVNPSYGGGPGGAASGGTTAPTTQ